MDGEATEPRHAGEPFQREPDSAVTSVSERIAQAFRNGHRVQLSFANVELTVAAFLNVTLGQLYGEFNEEEIRARLSVTDIGQPDLAPVKLVVDSAKAHIRRQRAGSSALQNELQAVTAEAVSSTSTN
ncbi:MAG TPA: STAS-like domain-containing protein [Verrucomicrobiota bacterium]|nr:STAS-like domain-containing protein [Verrucomicrobiota bacterium]HNU52693.1 STAS-like domain-containing protein [Verrucomicrobiota bacterium]